MGETVDSCENAAQPIYTKEGSKCIPLCEVMVVHKIEYDPFPKTAPINVKNLSLHTYVMVTLIKRHKLACYVTVAVYVVLRPLQASSFLKTEFIFYAPK